ncbi:MAG: hypothetical protein ACU833_02660 [Gammaproteobacteria bacterium]
MVNIYRELTNKITDSGSSQELIIQNAYHEAGYAAAIHLNNKQKKLPPIYFKVTREAINNSSFHFMQTPTSPQRLEDFAKVVGGRLIGHLPVSIADCMARLASAEKDDFKEAFEADIINCFVGSLAEAKYVSFRDDEAINLGLVNFNSLVYYGGEHYVQITREYLDLLIDDDAVRKRKIGELFYNAFRFVSDQSNWKAIEALAEYILECRKNVIECEEAIAVLENAA